MKWVNNGGIFTLQNTTLLGKRTKDRYRQMNLTNIMFSERIKAQKNILCTGPREKEKKERIHGHEQQCDDCSSGGWKSIWGINGNGKI